MSASPGSAGTGSAASSRAWRIVGEDARGPITAGLAGNDLRSLFLDVADARADAVRPSQIMRSWASDRFVYPSNTDPRLLSRVEGRMWELLPAEFIGIELSPVAPLGAASAIAAVSQRKVVTTMRLSEVVSDSTNVLAIEAAARRLNLPKSAAVHLASAHRQLRAQRFGAGGASHIRLFALVSSARDRGSGRAEIEILTRHLHYWRTVLEDLIPDRRPRIEVTVSDKVYLERLRDTLLPRVAGERVPVLHDERRTTGLAYYRGLAIRLSADDGEIEIGDGGFTDWTSQLLPDAKERCVVTCLSTERLASLAKPSSGG